MFRTLRTNYLRRLEWQLILPQLGFSLLLGVAGVVLVFFHTHQQMVGQLRQRGEFIAQAIQQAANNASSADAFGAYIEALGSAHSVELILIAGKQPPVVIAATDWSWVGRTLESLPEVDMRVDLDTALKTGQSRIDPAQGEGNIFDYSAPLDLGQLGAGNGALMAHLDMRDAKRDARQAARTLSIVVLVLVFGISFLQLALVRRMVLRPQAQLLEAIRRRTEGGREDAQVAGDHELARLAREYNHLIATLDSNEELLRRQHSQLQQADRAKTEFLSNLSHEIRTPLNGLLGITDLLSLEELGAEQQSMLNEMRQSGENLRALLDRVLELAQLEMGRLVLNPAPVVLAEMVMTAMNRYAAEARRKGLPLKTSIDPDLPEAIVADGRRLQQILAYLVDNAVKFTEHGEIEIAVSMPGTKTLQIDVIDSGIGIAPELAERIFESFVQADGSATRRAGGNGLGLAIVKRLVTLMAGHIEVIARPKGGSIFRLNLPLEAAEF